MPTADLAVLYVAESVTNSILSIDDAAEINETIGWVADDRGWADFLLDPEEMLRVVRLNQVKVEHARRLAFEFGNGGASGILRFCAPCACSAMDEDDDGEMVPAIPNAVEFINAEWSCDCCQKTFNSEVR